MAERLSRLSLIRTLTCGPICAPQSSLLICLPQRALSRQLFRWDSRGNLGRIFSVPGLRRNLYAQAPFPPPLFSTLFSFTQSIPRSLVGRPLFLWRLFHRRIPRPYKRALAHFRSIPRGSSIRDSSQHRISNRQRVLMASQRRHRRHGPSRTQSSILSRSRSVRLFLA